MATTNKGEIQMWDHKCPVAGSISVAVGELCNLCGAVPWASGEEGVELSYDPKNMRHVRNPVPKS